MGFRQSLPRQEFARARFYSAGGIAAAQAILPPSPDDDEGFAADCKKSG